MLKFIRGNSQSSTSSKLSASNKESNENTFAKQPDSEHNNDLNTLSFDPGTNRLLFEVKLNSVLHHKLLAKLSSFSKKKRTEIKFHKEASSLNSSCNDSVISSCGSDSTVSRCTSSCGERSSLSELELSCLSSTVESSDNEEINKYVNNKESVKDKVQSDEDTNNTSNKNNELAVVIKVNHQSPTNSQSFKVESRRRSILLSNQITKSKTTSISTVAPKLFLPKEILEHYNCLYSKPKLANNIMVKFFTYSLREDVEYKTLSISNKTTSKQVINILLDKFKMKHRDSNLFYLTMEILIRKNGIPIKSVINLNNEACPAQLKACYPNDEIRFLIESKPGGLIRVYDSCLMSGSLYKSILIDISTTVSELVQLVLNCYKSKDRASNYSLYVVDKLGSYKLADHELPLYIQEEWNLKNDPKLQLRKTKEINYNYLNQMFLFKGINPGHSNRISLQIFQDHFYI